MVPGFGGDLIVKTHQHLGAPCPPRGAFVLLSFVLLPLLLASCDEEAEITSAPDSIPATEPSPDPPDWWEPEAFEAMAQARLQEIVEALDDENADQLTKLVVDPSSCVLGELRPPARTAEISTRENHTVRLWANSTATPHSGTAAWEQLTAAWPAASGARLKVKNFDVQLLDHHREAETRTDFHALIAGPERSLQQTGKWLCRWQLPEDPADPPRLRSISLLELEEIGFDHQGRGPALRDITRETLGTLKVWHDSLQLGANHWILRLPRLKHRFQHGLAVGDVDQNGLEDLYLCQPEGLPNLLLLRQPDGSVREAAAEFGLHFRDISTSALLVDFDNDGDQDLAIAFRSPLDLFENVGGTFEHRFHLAETGQIFNLAAADPDADGLLDLFVCRYQNLDEKGRAPGAIPLHDARNGGRNTLLKNLGDWKFADVTAEVGLDQHNDRWTVAAAWEDYDRDGDLDLYLANDYGRNNLYQCRIDAGGQILFTDIAAETGVEDMTTSMGVTWADPNRDGRPDVYVSNMYSSAGRRVTAQGNFKRNIAGSDKSHVEVWQHAAMGNSLFQSQPDGSFLHASKSARINKGLWSWGTTFADLNHDGWDDLLIANGFITGPGKAPDL